VWDTSGLLDENSTLGELLKAVLGYNANPSLLEVIGYWAYWAFALIGVPWLANRKFERRLEVPQQA
jgi:high-affinity iron transporter